MTKMFNVKISPINSSVTVVMEEINLMKTNIIEPNEGNKHEKENLLDMSLSTKAVISPSIFNIRNSFLKLKQN